MTLNLHDSEALGIKHHHTIHLGHTQPVIVPQHHCWLLEYKDHFSITHSTRSDYFIYLAGSFQLTILKINMKT